MPRQNPMPEQERVICRRLRQFRLSLGLSQTDFCELAGLSRTAYAGYEYETSQLNHPPPGGPQCLPATKSALACR